MSGENNPNNDDAINGDPKIENSIVSTENPVVGEGDNIPPGTPIAEGDLNEGGEGDGGDDGDGDGDNDGEEAGEQDPLIIPSRGTLPSTNTDWFKQPQYILFSNELKNIKKSNLIILKECKESKRLLDLKFADLTNIINRIQTSVILLSTISGFFNATKVQFGLSDEIISVMSITISTYVSLVLSVSKYFKYDESKEGIQTLREKFSVLHNQIEHRMDILGPWNDPNLWKYSDPDVKLREWDAVKASMQKEYVEIIDNKQKLTTEFEITMDTKSRNSYHITNKKLTYDNRVKLFSWAKKEMDLEDVIEEEYDRRDDKQKERLKARKETESDRPKLKRRHSLFSNHEVMEDNWDAQSDKSNA